MKGIAGDKKITTVKSFENTTGEETESLYFNASCESAAL